MITTQSSPVRLFPNYLQMRPLLPRWVWHLARAGSIVTLLAICALLFALPSVGLFLFWRVAIPILPLVFLVAPGLWRNVCPLAAANQLPRQLGLTRGRTLPRWLREYAYLIGIALFLILVASRKVLFNQNGPALGGLLLAILGSAVLGGVIFKGKSGWCSSFCPLLPVQRLYGQTPYATIRNSHCQSCVGCAKNCYDFNPHVAALADLAAADRRSSSYRKFFAGAFPGVILAFYTVPDPPAIAVLELYLRFALYLLVAVGSFFALEALVKETAYKLTTLYGALAFNLYYWFTVPLFLGMFLAPVPAALVWALRLGVVVLTASWVVRSYRKERLFVAQAEARVSARAQRPGTGATLGGARQVRRVGTVEPGDQRVVAEPTATL